MPYRNNPLNIIDFCPDFTEILANSVSHSMESEKIVLRLTYIFTNFSYKLDFLDLTFAAQNTFRVRKDRNTFRVSLY